MKEPNIVDCILVGYHDRDMNELINAAQPSADNSGLYHSLKLATVPFQGKRYTYTDLLNHAIAKATGQNPQLNAFEAPSLGVFYLANFLQKRGLKTEIVNFFTYEKEQLKSLLAQSPRAVAITTTFYVEDASIIEIINFVRKHNPHTKIIVGGPHIFNLATQDQEIQDEHLRAIGADIYIIDSQGENTLSQVLQHLRNGQDLHKIPNLVLTTLDGHCYHRTQRVPEDNQLDANSIDWRLFDPAMITPIAYLRTARSCPFSCSFCTYPIQAGAHMTSSVDVVEQELRMLHEIGTKVVVFIDDTFNVPLPRFKAILRMMIRNHFNFKWVSFLRCSNVDEEAFELMEASGCWGVFLGIESGDQRVLNNMNKAVKLERYRWGLEQLNRRNIISYASLICGYPGETEETVKNTIQFIEETAPSFYTVELYFHDLQAPVQNKVDEFGLVGDSFSWQHATMSWQEACEWTKYMYRSITQSTPIPLYSLGMWGASYLMSRGISAEQLKRFGAIAKELLVAGLDDIALDGSEQEKRLIEVFRNTTITPSRYIHSKLAHHSAQAN